MVFFSDKIIQNQTSMEIDVSNYTEGPYGLVISAKDRADNKAQKLISFEIGKTPTQGFMQPTQTKIEPDQNLIFLVLGGVAAIGVAAGVFFASRSRKSQKR
jgi:hypothetical protein